MIKPQGLEQAPETMADMEAETGHGQQVKTADQGLGQYLPDNNGNPAGMVGKMKIFQVNRQENKDQHTGKNHGARPRSPAPGTPRGQIATGPGLVIFQGQHYPEKNMQQKDGNKPHFKNRNQPIQGMEMSGIRIKCLCSEKSSGITGSVNQEKEGKQQAAYGHDPLSAD